MFRKTLVLLAFFLVVLPTQSFAKGQKPERASVVLSKSEVIDGDYFAQGDSVILSGTVNGDIYVAGGSVTFDGTVNGDLLAAGGSINVLGGVNGDVRVAAGNVVISGDIEGSLTALAGTVTVTDAARIGKGFVPLAGQVSLLGSVGSEVNGLVGQMTLSSSVSDDVNVRAGQLTLTSGASVGGNLTYWSEQEVQVQEGATVSGEIKRNQPSLPDRKYALPGLAAILAGVTGAIAAFKIIGFLSALLLGLLLIKSFPVYTQDTADVVKKKPWVSLGVGFVSLIAVPLLVIILFVTVIGWVLALITVFAYLVIWYLAQIFVALFLGQRLFVTFSKKRGAYWGLFLGLLVFALLDLIPFFGWVVGFALTLMGIGAVLIEGKTLYTSLRVKKII